MLSPPPSTLSWGEAVEAAEEGEILSPPPRSLPGGSGDQVSVPDPQVHVPPGPGGDAGVASGEASTDSSLYDDALASVSGGPGGKAPASAAAVSATAVARPETGTRRKSKKCKGKQQKSKAKKPK